MKKTTIAIALALVLGIGFTASNSFARNHGGGHGGDHNGNYSMNVGANNSPEFKQFLQDTQKIRAEIMADRVELDAIMNGQNPDSKRARVLAVQINDKELQLAEVARKNNIQGGNYNYGKGWSCGISGHSHNFGNCW